MLGSCTYPKSRWKPPKKHVVNKWRTAERLLFSCRLSFIRFLVHIPNLPWKVSLELQVIDLSLSGNPNLQEVSCVLGLQSLQREKTKNKELAAFSIKQTKTNEVQRF